MTREQLDARAEELGINPSPRWKDETVAAKIAEAEAAQEKLGSAPAGDAAVEPPGAAGDAASDQDTTPGGGAEATGPTQGAGQSAAPTIEQDPAMITVTGPKRGRWRAGRHFTAEPVRIPMGDLTEAEIAQLTGDPKLTVSGLPQD